MPCLTRSLIVSVLVVIGVAQPVPGRAEVYRSVHVDGAAPLVFDADPRMHLRIENTIELVLAMPSPPATDRPVPVFSLLGRGGLTLWVSADRKRIGVTAPGALPDDGLRHEADLAGGDPRHIALHVRAGGVDLRVDGGELQGTDFVSPEAPSPEGLSLAFGSAGGASAFRGWVRVFRLWHDTLTTGAVAALREERGRPAPSDAYDLNALAVYSHFTDVRQILFHTRRQLAFTGVETGEPGDDVFVPFGRPQQDRARRVIAVSTLAPGAHLRELQVILGIYGNEPTRDSLYLPFVLPLNPGRPALEIARYWSRLRVKVENSENPFSSDDEHFFKVTIAGVDQFGLEDPEELKGETMRPPGLDLGSIVGTHDGVHLTSVAFRDRADKAVASFGRGEVWHQPFLLRVPQGTVPEGLTLRRGAEGLTGIGLAFSAAEQDGTAERLAALVGRRLVAEGAPPPVRLDSDIDGPNHGSFTDQTVYVLRRIPGAPGVALLADTGADAIQAQYFLPAAAGSSHERADLPEPLAGWADRELVLNRKGVLEPERHRILEAAPHPYRRMAIIGDRVHLLDRADDGSELVLRPPHPYEDGGDDKLPWGATFSLEQRATRTQANFVGYDLLTMDPRDYQSNIGRHEEVFGYPGEDSRAYRSSDSRIIFPNGLLLDSDARGSERSTAEVVRSREAFTSFWSRQVGGKIGIPNLAAFSANEKHAGEASRATSQSSRTAIATTRVNHYGLVVDRARMELSADFRDAVTDLRDRLLAGLLPDENADRVAVVERYGSGRYEAGRLLLPSDEIERQHGFSSAAAKEYEEVNRLAAGLKLRERPLLQRFGTHFPYAVTYGGTLHYTATDLQSGTSGGSKTDEEIRRDAEATLAWISLGVNDARASGRSNQHERDLESERSSYGSYGGTLSSNGGWSLARGEEVPILLDLRPIHRLLSPIHFDDVAIWTELRHRILVLMRLYVDRVERGARPEVDEWERRRNTLVAKAQLFCGPRVTPEACEARGWR